MDKEFRSKLRKKDLLLGTVLGIASSEVAEIISEVGFDWVWIDMEHATIDLVQAQIMTQALREGCASVVRLLRFRNIGELRAPCNLPRYGSNLYPTPRMVSRWRGSEALSSSFALRTGSSM